jgi:hypothetical protein
MRAKFPFRGALSADLGLPVAGTSFVVHQRLSSTNQKPVLAAVVRTRLGLVLRRGLRAIPLLLRQEE